MNFLSGRSKRKLGTFAYLQPGWWVLHVVSIIVIFIIGYLLNDDCYY